MADRFDKSFARRPTGEAPRRDDAADLPEDDPLVELARIVSGNESFDQILGSRYQPQQPQPRQSAPRSAQPPRDTSFDLEAELLNDLHSSFDPAARPAPRAPEPRAADPRLSQPRAADPVRPPSRPVDPVPRADDFDHMAVRPGAPVAPPRAATPSAPPPESYVAAPDFGRGRVSESMQRRPPVAPPAPPVRDDDDYGDEYIDDEDLRAEYEDEDNGYVDEPDYEIEPPPRSRKALITAGVVLVVLVAGGLGALALKGRSSVSGGAPQVITADQSPTKIEPEVKPVQNQDTQQNKLIYDRVDPDKASPDQLQIPDDSTADATAQSNESQASREISRIILPGGPGDQSTTPAVPGGADNTVPNSGDEVGPRKVRTVVVKPDGTIVSSEAAPRGAAPAADASAPASTDVASATPPAPAAGGADTAQPTAADDTVAPAKDNSQLSEPAPAAPEVAAAPAPVPATPEPAARAAAPSSGGFVVQVSSQRSEDAAQTAFKNLQRKFPSLVGDRTPDIARADLGAKGIYYRVRVGPMATRDEAVNFCEQLRAAGGSCIVQKN